MNNTKKKIIKILITIGIGVLSVLVLEKNISFQFILSGSIQMLEEQGEIYKAIIRTAGGMMECLRDIEGLDPIVANNLRMMGPLYVVIIAAIYIIRMILMYASKIIFWFLLPVACIHYLAFICRGKTNHKRKMIQCFLWIGVLLIVLPVNVKIAEKMEQTSFYSIARETKDYLISYDEDVDSVKLPSTNEEAQNLAVNNSKTFGLLVVSKVILPIVLIALFMGIIKMILYRIPFIKKQLYDEDIPKDKLIEITETEEVEKTPEEIQAEVEKEQKEQAEKIVRMKKYRRNKWIRRAVFLILVLGCFFGLKTGRIVVPDQVKSILLGTSQNLEYIEYNLPQNEEICLLEYEDVVVTTKGLKENKYGGYSLTLISSSEDFDVFVTDVFVNGIEVDPCSTPIMIEDSVRLYDEILKKYAGISAVSDISFTLGISRVDSAIYGSFASSSNVKLIVSDKTQDFIDLSNLAEPVYSGEEITIWPLGKGKITNTHMDTQYYLVDNRSDYDVQMHVSSVLKNDAEIAGEYGITSGCDGQIKGGHYGLVCFESYEEELEGNLKTKIEFEAEYHIEQLNLFGKEYREIWKYRKTYGNIDNTDYIDIKWIYTPL